MAKAEDLSRLGAHLRTLAEVVHTAARVGAGGRSWAAVVLDTRFSDADGSFIDKVRVERTDGSIGSVSLPAEGVLELIGLGQSRPTGPDRWHGLVLRVTAEGTCEVRLNYEPACEDNGGFFES